MKIRAECQCGKAFQVASKHAGKKGKCPKCGSVVVIPFPELTEDDVLSESNEVPSVLGASIDDLLDDTLPQMAATCPSCSATLTPGALLCVSCGYHLESGRRLNKTVVDKPVERMPSLPPGVDVKESDSKLVLSMRGASQSWLLVVFVSIVLVFFVSFVGGIMFGSRLMSGIGGFLMFPGILAALGYSVAGALLNHRVIEVDSSRITIRTEGPVPWVDIGSNVPVADVAQLYVVEKRRRKQVHVNVGSVSDAVSSAVSVYDAQQNGLYNYMYDINVVFKNGWRRRVFQLPDRRAAKYIEKRIERFLAVRETPVLSTWYQRWLLGESTPYDDRDDFSTETAISAKSMPLPLGVLVPGCLFLALTPCCILGPLVAISWPDRKTVSELTTELESPDARTRAKAAVRLYRMGPDAKGAIPTLIDSLGDSNAQVVAMALATLGKLGDQAVPALIEALEDSNPQVRQRAIESLGMMARGQSRGSVIANPSRIIDVLEDAASNHSDETVRSAAQRHLKAMGRSGNPTETAPKKE